MTTYNPAQVERLIARARQRYAATGTVATADALDMADQLEAARAEIARLTEDLNHATAHEGDWLSKASRRMCETVLGERDALRSRVRALESELATLRASVVAALSSAGPNTLRGAARRPLMKPTVGRIVHFLPPYTGSDQPRAGLVIAINQMTGRPDIAYWDISGDQHIARDVEQSETLQPDRWCWPPRS